MKINFEPLLNISLFHFTIKKSIIIVLKSNLSTNVWSNNY